jgi:serine/threonine protein kinase
VDDNSITQLGSIAGTPQYMSPEQARGAQLDQQSDLFSLGSLLYALCTGRPPFRDETSYGVMRKIIDEEPEPIRKYSPDTPLWMVELVEQLMAKEKAHRFKSAKEVHSLLDACISHVQHPASNPIPSQLLLNQNSMARKKLMKLFAGIGIVMVAALLGIVQLRFNYLNQKTLEDNYVFKPLSEVDGYIETMMKSDYDPIFLNLGLVGEDENYFSIMPTSGGVTFRYSAYDVNDYLNKRQAKHVPQLTKAAESMSLSFSEKSDLASDGSVRGIQYELLILGDSETVATTVRQLITKTFNVNDSSVCGYRYLNMPGNYYRPKGQEEREVSKDDFLRAWESGKLVYMGEQNLNIFLIPKERLSERPVTLDSAVVYTDARKLSSEEIQRIRSSK